jgi:hypothetical protein
MLHRSYRWGLPVSLIRPVSYTGQTGGHSDHIEMSQKASMTPLGLIKNHLRNTSQEKQEAPQTEANQHDFCQELTQGTSQRLPTDPVVHPSQKPTRVGTGQTGVGHWSDRSRSGYSGWTPPAGQLHELSLPISRFSPWFQEKLCGTLEHLMGDL